MGLNQTSFAAGEKNANAVLCNTDVLHARIIRYTLGTTVEELAELFGVGRSCMSLLLRGKTYHDAGGPIDPGRKPPSRTPGRRSKSDRLERIAAGNL